jgi:hypothetical protein
MTRLAMLAFSAVLGAGVALGAGDEPAVSQRSAPARPRSVACTARGADVTVALAYDAVTIGHLSATYVDLVFHTPLSLPGETRELRDRVTTLLPQGTRVGPPTLENKRLRVALASSVQPIPPGDAVKIRFDCPSGSRLEPGALSCQTAEATGPSGEPLHADLARGVRCVVKLDPEAR